MSNTFASHSKCMSEVSLNNSHSMTLTGIGAKPGALDSKNTTAVVRADAVQQSAVEVTGSHSQGARGGLNSAMLFGSGNGQVSQSGVCPAASCCAENKGQ